MTRETREGWPLLTVETDGDSKSATKGALLWLVHWACRAGTKYFCPALAAQVGPVQNKHVITHTHTYTESARIFKLLRSPGTDSKKSIPPAYAAWRAGTTTLYICRTGPPGCIG